MPLRIWARLWFSITMVKTLVVATEELAARADVLSDPGRRRLEVVEGGVVRRGAGALAAGELFVPRCLTGAAAHPASAVVSSNQLVMTGRTRMYASV